MTTETTATLRTHLETFRDFVAEHALGGARDLHYMGDMDLVLREGHEFQSVPWKTWRGKGYRRGKVRECFKNAHHLALGHPELTYCEGFASRGVLPILHAWCVTADGRVVDPTWREHEDFGDPVEKWEYLGIPLSLDFVAEVTCRKATYGVLDDHSIYEQPLPDGAVKEER